MQTISLKELARAVGSHDVALGSMNGRVKMRVFP